MTFAHYSVREYLESNRTLNAIFSHRTTGGGNPKDRLWKITLSEAQRIEPRSFWKSKPDFINELDVIRMVNSTFSVYCVVSAFLSLYLFLDQICQENTLKALAIDLLDPSMPHFPTMEDTAYVVAHKSSLIPSHFILDQGFPCIVQWHPDTKTELKHLYDLLQMTGFGRDCLPLVETFLQGKDPKSLLPAQVCFSRHMWTLCSDTETDMFTFKGSFIEVFAQLAVQSVDAFRFLIEVGAGLFDPSIALLLYIGGHSHWGEEDCNNFCPLQRLLEAGADPNIGGY